MVLFSSFFIIYVMFIFCFTLYIVSQCRMQNSLNNLIVKGADKLICPALLE